MGKDHLKRMSAPKTWAISRKDLTFVTRPYPSGHPLSQGLALGTLIKDVMGYADTNKQVTLMMRNKTVHLDGKKKTDRRAHIGFFDVLSFPDIDEHYRLSFNQYGRLVPVSVNKKEASLKLCKIMDKSRVKGKTQLQFHDGRNMLVDKDTYKTGDSVVMSVPKQEIKDHVKLEKGVLIFLTGGKHVGHTGTVEDMKGKKILYKTQDGQVTETLKKYAFVVGKDKPLITIAA